RHEHHGVLILTHAGLTLGFQESNHGAADLADPDCLTNRLGAAEQLAPRRFSEDAHAAPCGELRGRKQATALECVATDRKIVVVAASYGRLVVAVAPHDELLTRSGGGDLRYAADLPAYRFDVVLSERRSLHETRAATTRAGVDDQQIVAQLADVLTDFLRGAFAVVYQRNHR